MLGDNSDGFFVTLDAHVAEARAGADGRWRLDLPAHEAGGPFTLTVAGRSSIRFRDVLVGDVWVASGQSNMTLGRSTATGA